MSFFLPSLEGKAKVGSMHDNNSAAVPLTVPFSRKGQGDPYPQDRGNLFSRAWWTGFLALAVILVVVNPATAHTRSQSFSSWYIQDGQVWLSFSAQSLEATRLGLLESNVFDLHEVLVKHLAARIGVSAGGEACGTVTGPQARGAREGYLRVEWRFACPTGRSQGRARPDDPAGRSDRARGRAGQISSTRSATESTTRLGR